MTGASDNRGFKFSFVNFSILEVDMQQVLIDFVSIFFSPFFGVGVWNRF